MPSRAGRAIAATCAAMMLCGASACQTGAAAQESAPEVLCPSGPVPDLAIVADVLPFTYDHGRSVAALGGVARDSVTTSGHDVKRMLGLTRQSFSISINSSKAITLVRPDGSACVGFSDGTILLQLKTEIFVASELAPDSCLHREVLNHEERHAKVGKRLFGEFVESVNAAVGAAIAAKPFIDAPSRESAPEEALAWLRKTIEPHYRDFKSTYRKRQAIIDTSGEYARVAAACPGEQDRVLNGAAPG